MLQNAIVNQPPAQPAAIGSNKPTLETYRKTARELGEQAGKGEDTWIKFLLSLMEGGYHGSLDLLAGKHGSEIDDAALLAQDYFELRNKNSIFNAKSRNQSKLISCCRTSIKFGALGKFGVGEPIGTANNFLRERQNLRKNPAEAKKLDDAANSFLRLARAQLRRDTLIDPSEFKDYLYKKSTELPTSEQVVEGIRNKLQQLVNGDIAHKTVQDGSQEVRDALQSLTKRLIDIAKAKSGK